MWFLRRLVLGTALILGQLGAGLAAAKPPPAGATYTCNPWGFSFILPPTWRGDGANDCTSQRSSGWFLSRDKRARVAMLAGRAIDTPAHEVAVDMTYAGAHAQRFSLKALDATFLGATYTSTQDNVPVVFVDAFADFGNFPDTNGNPIEYAFEGRVALSGNRSVQAQLRAVYAVLASTRLFSPPVAHASPGPANPAQAVNLRLSDLPAGFRVDSNRTVDNTQAAQQDGTTVAQEQQRGRLVASEVSFDHFGHPGWLGAASTVVRYTSPAKALAAYALRVQHDLGPGGYRAFALGPVGSASQGLTYTMSGQARTLTGHAVDFVRRAFVCKVTIYGIGQPYSPQTVLALARLVDSRIQHTH